MVSIWNILKAGLLGCWLAICMLSVNYLFSFWPLLNNITTRSAGILGWITALLAILVYGRRQLGPLLLMMACFAGCGMIIGTYLEPPADPLEHLRRIHEGACGKRLAEMPQPTAVQIPRTNMGLWHYSMAGVILCTDKKVVRPLVMLAKIHVVNGLFWSLAAAVLFILGIRSGLPVRWACFSVMLCFLFFGTNRFSYFRYYSLAPTFTSILVYWLWTASFFFTRTLWHIIGGLGAALLAMPVLWVNHCQEAVFLGLLVTCWLLLNLLLVCEDKYRFCGSAFAQCQSSWKQFHVRTPVLVLLFVVLWGLPQSAGFRQWLGGFFLHPVSIRNTTLVRAWHDVYLMGNIGTLRIRETLGTIGAALAVMSLPLLWKRCIGNRPVPRTRLLLLTFLPFAGFLIPLFHFVWASNVWPRDYYRLCYASMYWLLPAYLCFLYEERASAWLAGISTRIFGGHNITKLR